MRVAGRYRGQRRDATAIEQEINGVEKISLRKAYRHRDGAGGGVQRL